LKIARAQAEELATVIALELVVRFALPFARNEIRQVLSNPIVNAVEAMDDGGVLTVITARAPKRGGGHQRSGYRRRYPIEDPVESLRALR